MTFSFTRPAIQIASILSSKRFKKSWIEKLYAQYNQLLFYLSCSKFSVPQTFVIWWNAWNDCDPNNFPLPSSISQSHYTYDSGLFSFVHLLFDHRGRESQIGISVRKAWEKLDPQAEARDLIVYCWCVEKSGNVVRNAIAHPVATKTQAEQLLSRDLCRGLQCLHPCAMKYVSTSNDFTT